MAKKDKKQDALSPEQIQEGTQQSDKAPAVQTSPVGQPVAQTTTSNSSTTAQPTAVTPTQPTATPVDDSLAARIATAKAGVQVKRDAATAEREAADEKAREILLGFCSSHALVLSDPAPMVRVLEYGESGVIITARVWVNSEDYWTVNFDILEGAKKHFDKNGITIPYNQLDVRLRRE